MTLKQDMITDLAVFFNDDEFADEAVYTPSYTAHDAVDITAIQLGYPTILTAVDHGMPAGATVALDGFEGDDAELLNDLTAAALYLTDNTFAVDVDTTGADITVGDPEPTATPEYPEPSTIMVLFDKIDGAMLGMEGTLITVTAKTADVAAAKPGETLAINGVTYKIKSPPVHDAHGTTTIDLTID